MGYASVDSGTTPQAIHGGRLGALVANVFDVRLTSSAGSVDASRIPHEI